MKKGKKCVCGHIMSSHSELHKNKKIGRLKQEYSFCRIPNCLCKKFREKLE